MTSSYVPWETSKHVCRRMRANRGADTAPELAVRRALHGLGLRYRKHQRLDLGDLRVRPDVVFTRARVAVFVDGCFWYRCPIHATDPRANSDYWLPKLQRNVERDRRVDKALRDAGWSYTQKLWMRVMRKAAYLPG
jgi:DNA mismatch endonuclease, patch repair protein